MVLIMLQGCNFHKTNNLTVKFNKKPKKNWCVDGEELVDNRKIYNISIIHDVRIMLPNKNIKNLFIK